MKKMKKYILFSSILLLSLSISIIYKMDIVHLKNDQTLPWGTKLVGFQEDPLNNSIKIAILDSGIKKDHEDLDGIIKGEYNAIAPEEISIDQYGHGTAIAGIIAAQNNNYGIVGINPFAEIYDVKVLDENGRGNANNLIKGIKWCIDNDIDLINISFGYQKDNKKLKDIIDKAISKNIIIVAAAGNTYGFKTDYPANYNNVISVTSLDKELQRSSFAALGKIDFALPGEEILSTDNNGDYSLFEGTSFATAYASGVISVLLSKYKNEEIKLTFSEYIKKFVVSKEEWDTVNYGKGLLKITN